MSYVHFLDVFDPAGLPAGLSDRDAAEQARNLRLAAPSPRLLALLTRIRQQPPGITVNVVGGKDRLPVEWVAGEPPRVEGEGATCALWTLILPVGDDFEALQDAVPRLVVLAQSLGLRVFDEVQEAFAQQIRTAPATVAATASASTESIGDLPGPGDILILEPQAFFGSNFSSVGEVMRRQTSLSVREAVQVFLKDTQREEPYAWGLTRLVMRMLQAFPFESHGSTLWCDRHPLREPVFQSDGVRLIRVAPDQLEIVLRRLLPLARELFLAVAVPDLNLFVDRTGDPDKFKAQPMDVLKALDPDWSDHRMSEDAVDTLFQKELCAALQPHGFTLLEERGAYAFAFWRPLRLGGGRQVVSYGGSGLKAEVQSERFQSVKRSLNWPSELRHARVALLTLSEERQRDNPDWGSYPGQGGAVASPEYVRWAIEDIKRLILPQLDTLHTAKDLWNWWCRPAQKETSFPGFSYMRQALAWMEANPSRVYALIEAVYAARCLSDDTYTPLLLAWVKVLQPQAEVRAYAQSLRFAAAYQQLPQTPEDAPL